MISVPTLAKGFGSVVKHSTADPGIASSVPLTPTKITKRRYVLVLPRKNAPVYQCFTLGSLKNLVYMCGGRSSILHYGPLIETNYLPRRRMGKARVRP